MPRKKLIRTDQFPYHVCTRSNNREWFKLSLDRVWNISQQGLAHAHKLYPVEVHAFVLMSNHYHLLISTPSASIDFFMRSFNKYFSDSINAYTGVINHKFGGPYNWSIVSKREYLLNIYRYIFQNPVKAGMTSSCEEYPYSSLHGALFGASGLVEYRPHFEEGFGPWLDFFNRVDPRESEMIRRGLKRADFRPGVDPLTREKFHLESTSFKGVT